VGGIMWVLFIDFITSIISDLFKRFVSLGWRYPIFLSYLFTVYLLSTAFTVFIRASLDVVSFSLPSQYLLLVSAFLPTNWVPCLGLIISARLFALAYFWSLKVRKDLWRIADDAASGK
jgi:hypothetical protein